MREGWRDGRIKTSGRPLRARGGRGDDDRQNRREKEEKKKRK